MIKIKNKRLITTVSVILIIALIVGIISILPKATIDRKVITDNEPIKNEAVYEKGEISLNEEDFTLVGKDGDLELLYNKSEYTIKVVNTKTGYEWKSFVTDEEYIHNANNGATENTPMIQKKLKRLFDIGYTDFGPVSEKTSIIEDGYADVTYHKLKNGVAVEASFDFGITVVMEIWLNDGGLNVRIPHEKIKEEDKYGITLITVLPMFGACTNEYEEGFILFPDAGGGIYEIKVPEVRQTLLSTDMYFPRNFDLDSIESGNRQGQKNGIMPYFGLSTGKNAFVGYITEGEMNGYVTLTPTGVIYDLNRIDASINYRKSYSYIDPAGRPVTVLEKNFAARDFSVYYSFLESEDEQPITYGDMANTLRDFLVRTGRLNKAESTNNEGVKVNLQMLMTTKVDSMLGKYLQVMTSCDDVKNIVEIFDETERENVRVMLLGWQSTGYNIYPSSSKIAKNIGNLSKLCEYLNENKIENYTVEDYIAATTESKYLSLQNDVVYNETNLPVTNAKGNQYVRSTYKGYEQLINNDVPYLIKNNVGGIALDKAGWYVFDDYQKRFEVNRYEAVSIYRGMLKGVRDAGLKIATQRGNAYVLSTLDYLYDVPETGSSYTVIDREIPFYQMVIHGYIPYSLDVPGNMSINYGVQKLKWIEYGAEPTFLITKEMSENFKDSKVENAFATEFETWEDEIKEIREEFNTKLSFTGNCTMQDHKQELVNVYSVTYSNGKKIYINYATHQVTVDGVNVPALDYVVVDAANIAG